MKLVYKRNIIRGVRDRWISQYQKYADDYAVPWGKGKTAGMIRRDLMALNLETCTSGEVDRAIMATGWAENGCDECGRDFDVLVHIGAEPDYDARWQYLCSECLMKGVELLAREKAAAGEARCRGPAQP